MKSRMIRIPNSGLRTLLGEEVEEVQILDSEFAQFIAGQRHEISAETEDRVRRAMNSTEAKTKLFVAAYAQKGMLRLAKILRVLEAEVEPELFASWRIRGMSSRELLEMFSELNREKSNTLKEIAEISKLEIDPQKELNTTTKSNRIELDAKSKGKVIGFFRTKVVKENQE